MKTLRPIDSIKLSEKLHAVRNFELPILQEQIQREPRYVEMMWFLQWVSRPENHAGGLARFTRQLVEDHLPKLIPASLLAVAGEKRITPAQYAIIDRELLGLEGDSKPPTPSCLLDDFGEKMELSQAEKQIRLKRFAETFSPAERIEEIIQSAHEELATYLRELCEFRNTKFEGRPRYYSSTYLYQFGREDIEQGPPLHWPTVCKDILTWMDQRAVKVQAELAQTQVSVEILKWIRRAKQCQRPVWLTGSCRLGKTTTLRILAKAFPGQYRVVDTPDDQGVQSLCTAIASALGIEFTNDSIQRKRAKIEEVLIQAKLMLLFDESHFLYPVTVTKMTRPQRLDFVRTTIIDRGITAAFISTPQSIHEAKRKLEKMTGYTQGQWNGRMIREEPIELPEEISEEEKMAVARIHFPDPYYDEDYLRVVTKRVSVVRGSSIYAQTQKVAEMAWVIAQEHGREKPLLADIKEAAQEILPSIAADKATEASPSPKAASIPGTRKRMNAEEIFPGRRPSPIISPHNRALTPSLSSVLEPAE